MTTSEKVKLGPVRARVNYLEFYKTKHTLRSGTYEVEEHDGTISYCAVDNDVFCKCHSWYTQEEYDNWLQEQGREAMLDANLAWEPDDEDYLEFNERVRDHELSREVNYHDEDRIL